MTDKFFTTDQFNEDVNTLSCIPFLTRNTHVIKGVDFRDSLGAVKANPLLKHAHWIQGIAASAHYAGSSQ